MKFNNKLVKVYLGDTVGLVPDHCNKATHNFFGFSVHIKLRFTLHYSLLNVRQYYILKIQCAYLNSRIFYYLKMLTITWQCRVATNLQFVKKKKKKTTVFVMNNRGKYNKTRNDCIFYFIDHLKIKKILYVYHNLIPVFTANIWQISGSLHRQVLVSFYSHDTGW